MSARSKDPAHGREAKGVLPWCSSQVKGTALEGRVESSAGSVDAGGAGELLGAGAAPALPVQAGGACVGVPAAPAPAEQGLNPSTEEARAGVPWLAAPSTGCTSLQNSYPCLFQGFAALCLAAVELQGLPELWKGITAAQP